MSTINESPEVLELISASKNGDEDAYTQLYKRYTPLLHGKFIKKHIKTSNDPVEREDVKSILNLLFVEAVNSYNPEKSKLITHLTNHIRFRFTENYLKERMMPFTNNASKEKIVQKLNKTNCILTDNVFGMLEHEGFGNRLAYTPKIIRFEYMGQELDMPLDIFLTSFLPSITNKNLSEETVNIFNAYIKMVMNNEKGISLKLKKEFNKSLLGIKTILEEVVTFINKDVRFLEIKN